MSLFSALTATLAVHLQAFNIPAGQAGITLGQFADQSHMTVLFPAPEIWHQPTRPLSGAMSPKDALRRMLIGSGLTAHFVNTAVVILPLPNKRPHSAEMSSTCEPIILGGFYRSRYCDDGGPKVVICEMCR